MRAGHEGPPKCKMVGRGSLRTDGAKLSSVFMSDTLDDPFAPSRVTVHKSRSGAKAEDGGSTKTVTDSDKTLCLFSLLLFFDSLHLALWFNLFSTQL